MPQYSNVVLGASNEVVNSRAKDFARVLEEERGSAEPPRSGHRIVIDRSRPL